MHIVRPVFTGMALAIAGIVIFGMADTALAKTKKHHEAVTAQPQYEVQPSYVLPSYPSHVQPSYLHSGADRQLQGRF